LTLTFMISAAKKKSVEISDGVWLNIGINFITVNTLTRLRIF
jgi:hypothetical protein